MNRDPHYGVDLDDPAAVEHFNKALEAWCAAEYDKARKSTK